MGLADGKEEGAAAAFGDASAGSGNFRASRKWYERGRGDAPRGHAANAGGVRRGTGRDAGGRGGAGGSYPRNVNPGDSFGFSATTHWVGRDVNDGDPGDAQPGPLEDQPSRRAPPRRHRGWRDPAGSYRRGGRRRGQVVGAPRRERRRRSRGLSPAFSRQVLEVGPSDVGKFGPARRLPRRVRTAGGCGHVAAGWGGRVWGRRGRKVGTRDSWRRVWRRRPVSSAAIGAPKV